MPKAWFRTRLAELMNEKGLSRMDLVRATKMSYPTVVRYETEDMTSIDSQRISELMSALDCEYWELMEYYVEGVLQTPPLEKVNGHAT